MREAKRAVGVTIVVTNREAEAVTRPEAPRGRAIGRCTCEQLGRSGQGRSVDVEHADRDPAPVISGPALGVGGVGRNEQLAGRHGHQIDEIVVGIGQQQSLVTHAPGLGVDGCEVGGEADAALVGVIDVGERSIPERSQARPPAALREQQGRSNLDTLRPRRPEIDAASRELGVLGLDHQHLRRHSRSAGIQAPQVRVAESARAGLHVCVALHSDERTGLGVAIRVRGRTRVAHLSWPAPTNDRRRDQPSRLESGEPSEPITHMPTIPWNRTHAKLSRAGRSSRRARRCSPAPTPRGPRRARPSRESAGVAAVVAAAGAEHGLDRKADQPGGVAGVDGCVFAEAVLHACDRSIGLDVDHRRFVLERRRFGATTEAGAATSLLTGVRAVLAAVVRVGAGTLPCVGMK